MTEREQKIKVAFFKLLKDFQRKTYYCTDVCPFRENYSVWLSCPGKSWGRPDEPDKCCEEIFKWYMENSND
ncbi:MAG: hypothetical protein IJQ82_14150 [Selenomonadaceae bacterium]|nr:hypothetical protein [Selenomonadaceae bacterium]